MQSFPQFTRSTFYNYFGGKFYGEGAIFLGGNCPSTLDFYEADGQQFTYFERNRNM